MAYRWWAALLFLAGAVTALGAAYALSDAVDPVHRTLHAKVSLFRARSAEIEAVSVGNSHSQAVDFAALGVPGFHFWADGHDAFEATYMARYAAARAPRLRYVLVAASYGLQRTDHAAITSRDLAGRRRAMYLRARGPSFVPGDHETWLKAQFAPIVRTDHWRGVLHHLPGRRPAVLLSPEGDVQRGAPSVLSADSMAAFGLRRATAHASEGEETLRDAPDTPGRVAAAFESLARRLRGDGVVLVLYTPPYHESYLDHLAPGVTEEMRETLRPVLRHSNVVWFDFGGDPAFVARDDLFRNSDHLNAAGARVFSALLGRCLDALPDAPASCRRVGPGVPSPASTAPGQPAGPSREEKETAG